MNNSSRLFFYKDTTREQNKKEIAFKLGDNTYFTNDGDVGNDIVNDLSCGPGGLM